MYKIIERQELAPSITRLVVEAPLIARKRKAGNFIILRATETGERIPLTIVDSDPEQGTITLIFQAIGRSTHLLQRIQQGASLLDVAGPLGEATPVDTYGRVVCIGGGVGAAVVFPIAKALRQAGNHVTSIIGARNRDLVILEQETAAISDVLIVTTDDGSHGLKGFVTDALRKVVEQDGHPAAVYAIGPLRMMQAVAEQTRPLGIRTYASLNPIMMDGTGMCGACRVTVGGQMKFACVDGPEFNAHEIAFDELIARNNTYRDLEQQAMETCEHH